MPVTEVLPWTNLHLPDRLKNHKHMRVDGRGRPIVIYDQSFIINKIVLTSNFSEMSILNTVHSRKHAQNIQI